jgi:hypothetical protein
VLGCVVACASGCGAPAKPLRPTSLRVSIVSALIGPAKVSGLPWDGTGGAVDEGTWGELGVALGAADPYTAAVGILASMTDSGTARPDPKGTALLYSAGSETRIELPMAFRDTYTPTWSEATFHKVPGNIDQRLRITLIDQDVMEDDPIGVVELTPADLEAARASGRIYQVRVSDQSQNQILFIGISVIAE